MSAATTRTSETSTPSSSAAIQATTEFEPWPMSLPPVKTVTAPERSTLIWIPAWGILFG